MRTYALPTTDYKLAIGTFDEAEYSASFDYISSLNVQSWDKELQDEYPHMVCVNDPFNPWRYAKVLKTVAYVLCEHEVQKWNIKKHVQFN